MAIEGTPFFRSHGAALYNNQWHQLKMPISSLCGGSLEQCSKNYLTVSAFALLCIVKNRKCAFVLYPKMIQFSTKLVIHPLITVLVNVWQGDSILNATMFNLSRDHRIVSCSNCLCWILLGRCIATRYIYGFVWKALKKRHILIWLKSFKVVYDTRKCFYIDIIYTLMSVVTRLSVSCYPTYLVSEKITFTLYFKAVLILIAMWIHLYTYIYTYIYLYRFMSSTSIRAVESVLFIIFRTFFPAVDYIEVRGLFH